MACPHVDALAALQPLKGAAAIHREECTQCFDDQVRPYARSRCGGG
jgi:ubiquitin carboxyl-terminal hydrolase 5/13